jgi:Tol biopolymer transport system component
MMLRKTIGHYRIIEKLGAGGMGAVYKATDMHLDRFVALKTLLSESVGSTERKRRFVQEAKAASALNHPNIVHIYDIAELDGVHFIAMEYVKGKTLAERLGRKRLDLNDVLKYAVQMADALAKAHAVGIVHRDLKPSNIMVTDEGLVKVLDFGLAKLAERLSGDEPANGRTTLADEMPRTDEGVIVGTVAYMSPEQAEGRRVDARSDIFSFGSVLYEMITGQRAFRGDTRMSTMAAILREDIKPLSDVVEGMPREVERVIARCLRKDPARRFQHMDDLRIALQDLIEESDSGALTAAPRLGRRRSSMAWIPLLLAAGGIAAGSWLFFRPNVETPVTAVPLVTFAGEKRDPSFSPDGKQVAFAWNGEKRDNYDIYVKLIGAGTPLRLTNDPAGEFNPAWSPDGRYIAFLRLKRAGKADVFLISALGGPERKLDEISSDSSFTSMAWSPDGKWLAVPDKNSPEEPFSMFLLSVETSEKRRLTAPPPHINGDRTPAFSPDGRTLAFSRSTLDTLSDLYLLDLSDDMKPKAEPRRLTFTDGWVPMPAWTPDGREIIFSTGQWGSLSLWRIRTSGSSTPRRLAYVGEDGSAPAVSLQGHRMVYAKNLVRINIWRAAVSRSGSTPSSPVNFIISNRIENTPDFSPDDKRIAFASNRSGSWEIWVCTGDGLNAVQLTSFGGPFTRFPRWSPDGTRIVFDSRPEGNAEIYVISSQGGRPRRLTNSSANDVMPRWSSDGRSIYFMSNRGGDNQIWKMPADGGTATQVTKLGGSYAMESPDGEFLYYTRSGSLWRVPSAGGEETKILESASEFAVLDQGVYFMGWTSPVRAFGVLFFSFTTGKTEMVSRIEKGPHMGFSLSRDGRWALYSQVDQEDSDLMLVENFR